MVRTTLIGSALGLVFILSGCGAAANVTNNQVSSATISTPSNNQTTGDNSTPCPPADVPVWATSVKADGPVLTSPPTGTGPAATAWAFFADVNAGRYEDALATLSGTLRDGMTSAPQFLHNYKHVDFIRMADITKEAPTENEVSGAYDYRVYYLEVNQKLNHLVDCSQTALRDGLTRYAVYVVQEKKDGPWHTVLQEFAPPLSSP
ncbi:MAG: hypothetical protein IRZ10_09960 [Thermoflavifilum sp.]|nr:hypothetical protein [Thermoflavifilum sp.]MCL6514732.1 hypothetical protein [Alicyclobacillus sp.]